VRAILRNRRVSNVPRSIVIAGLALIMAACGGAPAISNPGRDLPTLAAPATAVQEVNTIITAATAPNLRYLGRLTQPDAPSTLFKFALSLDGTRLVGINNTVVLGWNLIDNSLLFQTTRRTINQLFYSPDKTELFGVDETGTVWVLDATTGALVTTFVGHENYSGVAAFDPLNGWLALGGQNGSIAIIDPFARSSQLIDADTSPITALTFSPDGEQIVSTGALTLKLHERGTGALIDERGIERATALNLIAYAASGAWVGVGTDFNAVLWSMTDRDRAIGLDTGQGGAGQLLLFASDGTFLLTGNRINGMTLWGLGQDTTQTSGISVLLPDTTGNRASAAFSPVAPLLVTAVLGGQVKLWDLGQVSDSIVNGAVLDVDSDRIHSVAWSDDGRLLLLFDAGGAVYLWGV